LRVDLPERCRRRGASKLVRLEFTLISDLRTKAPFQSLSHKQTSYEVTVHTLEARVMSKKM